jgi:hypothetical protein
MQRDADVDPAVCPLYEKLHHHHGRVAFRCRAARRGASSRFSAEGARGSTRARAVSYIYTWSAAARAPHVKAALKHAQARCQSGKGEARFAPLYVHLAHNPEGRPCTHQQPRQRTE